MLMKVMFRQWVLTGVLISAAVAAAAEVTLTTEVVRVSASAGEPGATAQTQSVSEVLPGDVLRYTIVFENTSTQDVAAGSVVITNPLPEGTRFLQGSAAGRETVITYSVDGERFAAADALMVGEGAGARMATTGDYRSIRWTYQPMLRAGESSQVSFELLIP